MHTRKFDAILEVIRDRYPGQDSIPLHVPVFPGREKEFLMETIDSTFVSSVGAFVNRFEERMADITGCRHAVATVNGTCALHIALEVSGVGEGDEVLTQALTFVATANAVTYCNARPVFLDVDRRTLGMSPDALRSFLREHAETDGEGNCRNTTSGRRIAACVPMHTFGHPCRIEQIAEICREWNIALVEDAAESLGSRYRGRHTGSFGDLGIFSLNGNKIVTSGGGGAIVTDDEELAKRARHLTTQAKVDHPWKYEHDEVGYNYRMPNLNAALACAQLEQLDHFVENKRETARRYARSFGELKIPFQTEPEEARSNYWLNAIFLDDAAERDSFLEYSNENGVMTRPAWELMPELTIFEDAQHGSLDRAREVGERLVNIPSSYTE